MAGTSLGGSAAPPHCEKHKGSEEKSERKSLRVGRACGGSLKRLATPAPAESGADPHAGTGPTF